MPDITPLEFTSPAGIRYISAPLPESHKLHPCQVCALGRIRTDCTRSKMYPGEPDCVSSGRHASRRFIWVEAPLVPEPDPNPL